MNRSFVASRLGLAAAFIIALASLAGAQVRPRPTLPSVGQKVRISARALRRDRYVGVVEALPPDSIQLDTAHAPRRLGFDTGPVLVDQYRKVAIPVSMIDAIDISTGKTYRKSVFKGSLIGAVTGGAVFGASNLPELNPTMKDFFKQFPIGAAIGGVVGGVVGYLIAGERWERFMPGGPPGGPSPAGSPPRRP